jgi:hypothetical protein
MRQRTAERKLASWVAPWAERVKGSRGAAPRLKANQVPLEPIPGDLFRWQVDRVQRDIPPQPEFR